MSDDRPLDLAAFDLSEPATLAQAPTEHLPATTDARLAPAPPFPRLVETDNLPPGERAEAERAAGNIDFRRTNTLLAHGETTLSDLAAASRQLLSGVRLSDAGEVGRVAAAVIDGIKILRIEDLHAEARSGQTPRKGIVGRLLGVAADAGSAFKGFTEGRRRFLDLMDAETAKARRIKEDLAVAIELLDRQAVAIRGSLHALKIDIAAGQLALDRGEAELETLRRHAVETADPADAADVLELRGALANFRGKIADMRETLVGSALLIPIVGQNRKAAETRLMQISNGMLVVIPRLMAVASQAVVQVDIGRAAAERERLDDAARQVTRLASQGAHDAATQAARSLAGDPRNIDVLAEAADQAIRTMHEVIDIEGQVADADRDREARLAAIRDKLAVGMRGVAAHATDR